jgi:nucleotide-binding universal stress UspA family protein
MGPHSEPSTVPAAEGTDDGRRGRVVVGVDGSPGARAALVQAIIEAARRGAELVVVAAGPSQLPFTGVRPVALPPVDDVLTGLAGRVRDLLGEAQEDPAVRDVPDAGSVNVRVHVASGTAAQVLVDAAAGAALLVVGSRGRGAVRSALLGSVALHCISHAPCPVLVVRGTTAQPGHERPVVVGVDGSEGSLAACRTAIEEAARRGVDVEVVAAYAPEDIWMDFYTVDIPSREEIRDIVHERTEEVAARAGREAAVPPGARTPEVRVQVADGAPHDVLVERAEAAGVLVVGSRGLGRIKGLLLGSVALHVAMHAACPVLVVRLPAVPATDAPQPDPALAQS